jgi:hypothetical protein
MISSSSVEPEPLVAGAIASDAVKAETPKTLKCGAKVSGRPAGRPAAGSFLHREVARALR